MAASPSALAPSTACSSGSSGTTSSKRSNRTRSGGAATDSPARDDGWRARKPNGSRRSSSFIDRKGGPRDARQNLRFAAAPVSEVLSQSLRELDHGHVLGILSRSSRHTAALLERDRARRVAVA